VTLEDLLMGSVACILGAVAIVASLSNWEACYQLAKLRWIESWGGRRTARIVYGLLGVSLIILGIVIALGLGRPGSRHRQEHGSTRALSERLLRRT
jgi:amino acid permease